MALEIPEGYGQVLIPLRLGSSTSTAAVTFGVRIDRVGFVDPDWCNDIQQAFADQFVVDNNVTCGPTIGRFNTSGGEPISVEGTVTAAGGVSLAVVPSNCALLLRKTTVRGGRRGRGRMFVPWYLEEVSVAENGTIDPSTVVAAQTGATAFLTELQTQEFPMVLLHDSEGSTAPGAPNLVTGLTADPVLATQRRRLRR